MYLIKEDNLITFSYFIYVWYHCSTLLYPHPDGYNLHGWPGIKNLLSTSWASTINQSSVWYIVLSLTYLAMHAFWISYESINLHHQAVQGTTVLMHCMQDLANIWNTINAMHHSIIWTMTILLTRWLLSQTRWHTNNKKKKTTWNSCSASGSDVNRLNSVAVLTSGSVDTMC